MSGESERGNIGGKCSRKVEDQDAASRRASLVVVGQAKKRQRRGRRRETCTVGSGSSVRVGT